MSVSKSNRDCATLLSPQEKGNTYKETHLMFSGKQGKTGEGRSIACCFGSNDNLAVWLFPFSCCTD